MEEWHLVQVVASRLGVAGGVSGVQRLPQESLVAAERALGAAGGARRVQDVDEVIEPLGVGGGDVGGGIEARPVAVGLVLQG